MLESVTQVRAPFGSFMIPLALVYSRTYGDLLKGGEGIATNILADRLAQLECAGIISKTAHPASKAKVLYRLTPKGVDLAPALVEIIAWSEKYHKVHPKAVAFAEEIKKNKAVVLAQIYAERQLQ